MLYSFFRLIIIIFIFLINCIFIKKIICCKIIEQRKFKHKKLHIFVVSFIMISIVSLLGIAFYWCPFENMIIDFSSPEDVFEYTSNGEIDRIVYADNSCMIIYTDNKSQKTLFALTDGDSYKIVTYPQYSKEHIFSKNYCSANIYTIKQTGDTYCMGQIISDESSIDVTDNFDTEYYTFKADENVYYFYGFIKEYDENYSVFINSKEEVLFQTT